jgi:hypothetical protein
MLCNIDLQFLHYNLPIGSKVGLVLLGHLRSKLNLVFPVTLPILGQLFLVILPVTPDCLLILPLLRFGGLCCIAFKPVEKDGAVTLDTTVSTGREKVWITEDTMGIPTLVTDLFGTRSEVRLFLSPATEVSGVVWETEVGIPTQRVRY